MKAPTDKKRFTDSTKLLWHMDRVIEHYDKGKRVAPIHIDVGLTKKCNVNCVFCYGYYQNMDGSIIQRDALLNNLVTSAADIGVRSLAFIGDGEPSLNPAYWDAMRLGKKKGLSLSTSTNGVLLDSDEKGAATLENCDWMRVNISAVSEEGYRAIHRSSKRDTVMKNIRDLVEYKHTHGLECDVGLQMVFVPTMMVKEVVDEAQFAIDNGLDYFLIKQCSLPDAGESGMVQFDMSEYDKPEVRDALKKVENMSTEHTDIIPKWNIIDMRGERKYEHCVGVQLLPEISGNGDFYPCAYFFGGDKRPELRYGNVHDNSLEEIVFSDKYWDIVKHMNETFDPTTECKGCCRQDMTNQFIHEYLQKPKGVNFI